MRHPSASSKFYPSPYNNQAPDYLTLSGGLHLWRGYFSSLRLCPRSNTSQGLLLNFDITSGPFYASGNGIEVAILLAGVRNDPRALLSLNNRQRLDMERGLRALKVKVLRDDGKTFAPKKVLEVSRVGAKALTFDRDGTRVTVQVRLDPLPHVVTRIDLSGQNYFRQTHNVNLRYPDLPCLRLSAKAWYPLELCEVPKGQKYAGKLSPEQLATAIKWQTVEPHSRMNKLLAGLKENYHPSISKACA